MRLARSLAGLRVPYFNGELIARHQRIVAGPIGSVEVFDRDQLVGPRGQADGHGIAGVSRGPALRDVSDGNELGIAIKLRMGSEAVASDLDELK